MKLVFTVNEPGTFFHFLDSISLWDIHTRLSVKKYYQKKFGLNNSDKELIEKYTLIRKKHGWKKLDSDFYPSKNFDELRRRLRKRLTKKDYVQLDEVIKHFYPNLHEVFNEWKKYLLLRKRNLEKQVKNHNLNGLFSEVINFYESKNFPKKVFVHLVANPSSYSSGGGANIFPAEHITIEPRRLLKRTSREFMGDISIIAHETLHLIEHSTDKRKWNQFKKYSNSKKLNFEILRESIADTLVPDGDLALRYCLIDKLTILNWKRIRKITQYKKSNPSRYYRKSRQKLSAMIYPLTKKQLEEGKTLFEGDYIKNCVEKYLEMRKMT